MLVSVWDIFVAVAAVVAVDALPVNAPVKVVAVIAFNVPPVSVNTFVVELYPKRVATYTVTFVAFDAELLNNI